MRGLESTACGAGASMQAIELTRYDAAFRSLRVREKPIPEPRRGEVLVRIERTPINPADLMFLAGDYVVSKELPVTPGTIAAGTVVTDGGGLLARALRGRRVCCASPTVGDGTWAQYMATPATLCAPLRKSLSPEQGCNLLSNPATALGLLEMLKRGGHEAAIQTAAAGDLGRLVHTLFAEHGIPLIHVVRRDEQAELVRSEGAVHVLVSDAEGFDESLRTLATRLGATLAFDAVAGDMPRRLLDAMPKSSVLYVFGRLSGQEIRFDGLAALVERQQTLKGFSIYEWLIPKSLPARIRLMISAQRLLERCETRIQRAVGLEAAVANIGQWTRDTTSGKTLIAPNPAGAPR